MNKTDSGNAVTGLEILTIVFIVLKLCKVITWSWWWVLAPVWVPVGVAAAILLVMFLAWVVVACCRDASKP